jgi:hypothetical protein
MIKSRRIIIGGARNRNERWQIFKKMVGKILVVDGKIILETTSGK